MNADKLLKVAAYAGRILLESGAETYRVEETMVRICQAYGAVEAHGFVTPTGIMLSFSLDDKVHSIVSRISERGNLNLDKIERINDLSRKIALNVLPIDELYEDIKLIHETPAYSPKTRIFFSAVSASCFAFFFQGGIWEALCSFVIGLFIQILSISMYKYKINSFFVNSMCASLLTLLSIIFKIVFPFVDQDIVIISSIMLLVPGLAITNAIRDTVAGDLVSGVTRMMDAFLTAVSIAVGTGVVMSLLV